MAIWSKLLITTTNSVYNSRDPDMLDFVQLYPPYGGLISAFSTIVLCIASYYIMRWLSGDVTVPIRDVSKTHSWTDIKITSKSWYCSICEELLINGIGVYCDCCGVCSDPFCIKKANKCLPCKVITSKSETQLHHWVKGNLLLGAVCDACQEECAIEPGLVDFKCCWCNRSVHEDCLTKLSDVCDFGPFKNMIVPPWCVQVARRKSSIHRHMLLRGVKHPGWKNWSPLIVVANKRSGNTDGAMVLSEFRRYLNPAQVLDLAERPPAAALQWSILMAPERVKLLAAGGDGTVAWILTTAYKLDLEPDPAVAIIPLGTGNDLSRVLGWGKENSADLDLHALLTQVQNAKLTEIDRWRIEVLPHRHGPLRNLGLRMPAKCLYMYNYIGIGVDAQVALDFHKARDSRFYVFGSRIFNKLLYLCFGTQQVVTSECRNLEKRLDLYLDGKLVELPELESIVVLNIPSWGAGVDLWGSGNPPQLYNDGVLEVVGIYSSLHIAQLQIGLSNPHRIGQGKQIEIHLKAKAPIQVDGEPWEQHPAVLKISLVSHATVLLNQL